MFGKVKELGHLFRRAIGMTGIREATVGITELIKKLVAHCLDSRETLSRCVFK